jgi:hypothetical protein
MKPLIVLALALLIVASSSYGVYRLLESLNSDDTLSVAADSPTLPMRSAPRVRRPARTQEAHASIHSAAAHEEAVSLEDDDKAKDVVTPARRDPEVLRRLRPWWTEKAKELQSAVARRAQSGASSADIQEMMKSFEAEVASQYDRLAAARSGALAR